MNELALRELIKALQTLKTVWGMDDKTFAKRIGLNPDTWCRIKKGERRPSIDTLSKIGRAIPELKESINKVLFPEEPVNA